jgi:probable rRNA maturation factor
MQPLASDFWPQSQELEPPPLAEKPRGITVLNQCGRRILTTRLKSAAYLTLRRHGVQNRKVTLLLSTDEYIRDLNKRFRNIDAPTDVLTFPSGDPSPMPLGEVAISVPYAERQANERKVSLNQELGYLVIHGALHLVGFDDETESDRARMVDEMNLAAVASGYLPDKNWSSILHESVDGGFK